MNEILTVKPERLVIGDVIGTVNDRGAFKAHGKVDSLNVTPNSSCNGVHVNEDVRGVPSECYDRIVSVTVLRATA